MVPFLPSFFRQLVLKYRPYPSQALAPLLTIPSSSPGFRIQDDAPPLLGRRRRGRARFLLPTRNFLFVVDGEKKFAKEDFPPLFPTICKDARLFLCFLLCYFYRPLLGESFSLRFQPASIPFGSARGRN